jgi:hypothetical protein
MLNLDYNGHNHLQEHHLDIPEMIICDDRQTDFSELTYSIPPSSISVPDSDLIMSSLTPLTRNDNN